MDYHTTMERHLVTTSFWRKLIAYCFDKLIIFSLFIIFLSKFNWDIFSYKIPELLGYFTAWLSFKPHVYPYIENQQLCLYILFLFIFCNISYYLLNESFGTTIGKRIFNLSICNKENEPINFLIALKRESILLCIYLVTFGILYLLDIPYFWSIILNYIVIYSYSFFNTNHKSLIDKLSNTTILYSKLVKERHRNQMKIFKKNMDITKIKNKLFPFENSGIYRLYIIFSIIISIYFSIKICITTEIRDYSVPAYLWLAYFDIDDLSEALSYFAIFITIMIIIYLCIIWIYNGLKK